MATARNIYPEAAVNYSVTVTCVGGVATVDNMAVLMNSTDTITFYNSSNSDSRIEIVFAQNPPGVPNPPGPVLFNNGDSIILNPGQNSGNLSPEANNGSVNYTIWTYPGGVDAGDTYSVQVGNGPLYVTAKSANSTVIFTPPTVRVPIGGTIQFFSVDILNHAIPWKNNNNPFTKPAPLTTTYPLGNSQAYTDTAGTGDYPYSGTSVAATGGGGTVKVGQAP